MVEVHPITAAIRSLESVPLYVSFATTFFPLAWFLPVVLLGGLLFRPTPLRSTQPARPPRLLLSSRVRVRFRFQIRLRLRDPCCRCLPFLRPLQVNAGLLPPPPRHPRFRPPSGPLTEVQNWSHLNILRDHVLHTRDRLSDPLEARFPHCLRRWRVICPSLC